MNEVIIFRGQASGVIEHLMNEHFALAETSAFRTVDRHGVMHAAEALLGRKGDVEAEARRGSAAVFASFQAQGGVVKNIAFIINNRATNAFVAHEIDGAEQLVAVAREGYKAHVVQSVSRGQAIVNLVEGAGIRPLGRKG